MNNSSEKRRFNRFDFQKSVQVYPVLPLKSGNIYEVQKNSIEVKASDISEGGLRLETSQGLDPKFLLKLNFEVQKDERIEVYAKIMWAEKTHCGVRFMLTDSILRKSIRAIAKKNSPSLN